MGAYLLLVIKSLRGIFMKKLVSLLVVAAFLFVAGDVMAKKHHKKHGKKAPKTEQAEPTPAPAPVK
jgi:large-conductance mechanosensitive channel